MLCETLPGSQHWADFGLRLAGFGILPALVNFQSLLVWTDFVQVWAETGLTHNGLRLAKFGAMLVAIGLKSTKFGSKSAEFGQHRPNVARM